MSLTTVTVKNHSSRNLYIDSDPNWDDQELLLDDKPLRRGYALEPDRAARISVDWVGAGNAYMMGVIFADGPDYDYGGDGFYQLTIGQNEDSGLLDVTDGGGEAKIAYSIGQQTPWSMTMDFADS
ncbi:hypothetical protein [Chromobacterium violaceum]|uniref:Uncharacterized protein n=1 Tax=Chromobacterium violaceum TaxID=536 RepID=A0A447TET1_CHRVL|nr:hypothetical protein [Chromobacterium violaceum]MBA8735697.1 hypothetical protein [Chromobacterium violaceum]MCD0490907.1 hypothetical protein [Chromobacterium violaceum]VEB43409.1 Uncharacterised protein [Chromobacterium violaceum]